MNTRLVLSTLLILSASASLLRSSEVPPVLPGPIAVKRELLFSDDFQSVTPAKQWHRVVDTFTFENGALKGTQTRVKDTPSPDGKSTITAHAAVYGLEIPTKDSIVECKIRFDGAVMMDVEFDDRKYTGSHYGHLCRAMVRLDKATILDEREGSQNEVIKALQKDPTKKAEVSKMLAGKSASFPLKLEQNKTYTFVVETVGDEMRASIDGKPVAYLKSPGIGHLTKSKLELGVAGQSGWFDDIKVWNAEPVRK